MGSWGGKTVLGSHSEAITIDKATMAQSVLVTKEWLPEVSGFITPSLCGFALIEPYGCSSRVACPLIPSAPDSLWCLCHKILSWTLSLVCRIPISCDSYHKASASFSLPEENLKSRRHHLTIDAKHQTQDCTPGMLFLQLSSSSQPEHQLLCESHQKPVGLMMLTLCLSQLQLIGYMLASQSTISIHIYIHASALM